MMKKILALLLCAALCLGMLAGCGSSSNNTSAADASGASDSAAAAASESSADAAEGEADASGALTVNDGVLTMGTNAQFPPYEFYEGDSIVGIDAEIAAALAEKLGLELEIVDMDFGSIITSVQTGKIDIGLAGMTVTPERQQNVSFTDSYATGVQVVIVPESSDITSVDDIYAKLDAGEDVLIGCQESTTGYIYASDTVENGGFGEEHVIAYQNGPTAVESLLNNKVDCVIIDQQPALSFVAANDGLSILDTTYVVEDYAGAVNKENTALLEQLNAALAELTDEGRIQSILDKYINAQ